MNKIILKKNCLWTINDYQNSLKDNEGVFKSEDFSLPLGDNDSINWNLLLHATKDCQGDSHTNIFLSLKWTIETRFDVEFKLKCLHSAGDDHSQASSLKIPKEELREGVDYGLPEFIEQEKLFNLESGFIDEHGRLQFSCEIFLSSNVTEAEHNKFLNLTVDPSMESMLEGEIDTDIQIIAKNYKLLKAHRNILAAKSTVFKMILDGKMRGLFGVFLDLREFDSTTVRAMLRFIYGCKIENLDEIAHKLIIAGERFNLDKNLKDMCVNSMTIRLNIENVVASLVVSHQVRETEKLFRRCIKLIASNIDFIRQTKEWRELPNSKELPTEVICELVKLWEDGKRELAN